MKKTLGLSLVLVLATACSSTSVRKSDDVEAIYKEAVSLIDRERFLEAQEYIAEIRHRFPQSRFAPLAELRSADIDFKQDNFTEAAAAYGSFVELYPNHAEAPYAQYQRAFSFFQDAPSKIARDQSPASDAAKAAEQLIRRYPQSPYVEKAKQLYQDARLRLAEKEAYVARFYERKDAPLSAFRRWQTVKDQFADIQAVPAGKTLLAEAEQRTQALSSAAEAEEAAQKKAAEATP